MTLVRALSSAWRMFVKCISKDWVSILFLNLFLVAWISNAFKKTSFDLGQLQTMYMTIRGALLLEHGINSKFNNQKEGDVPKRGEA